MNYEHHGYAANLGFFKSFGLNHGKEPGEAAGSSRYIPIRDLNVAQIKDEAVDRFLEVGDVIEERAAELAKILTQDEAGDLQDTLTYSIREIMRNVVEHSKSENIHVCAQYWPSRHEVEVGIVDDGIGVHAALTSNPAHDDLGEKEALELSLMPGISGNPMAGKGRNEWNNSGYGLYMTNRICRNGGHFLICSGGHGIELSQDGKENFETSFQGTAIRLFIDTRNLTDLRGRLAEFAEDGRAAAKELAGANDSRASTASQMLRRDFQDA
ncbi:ATP-binding protein [Thioclava electrotropha]|uniref:ATP-binding protein n=1 Tax=Thioclava electrotropha TaxID=1549850 RepID=A0ABX6YX40_9RHOB|nr:ATP-binding protein [Thioclava electrotropha]QPZ92318.1 ATP-binding protein [Thioclava electrotropha]